MDITCSDYKPQLTSKNCVFYAAGGGCNHPSRAKCTEWIKRNGGPPIPVVRNVTDEDIASFKVLGVEVCLSSPELGEVWLVPAYTSSDRRELTAEHAALITAACSAFPGSRVVSFKKSVPK